MGLDKVYILHIANDMHTTKEQVWGQIKYLIRKKRRCPKGCWYWFGPEFHKHAGFDMAIVDGKYYNVIYVLWWIKKGYKPASKRLTRTCDNPQCCNPGHWKDTTKYVVKQNTGALGERVRIDSAKTTEEQDFELWVDRHLEGLSPRQLSFRHRLKIGVIRESLRKTKERIKNARRTIP